MNQEIQFTEASHFMLEPDLQRRVGNLALGPRTPSNALVPLYEAIYNALHAAQDRFKDDWAEKTRINVTFLDLDTENPTIEVSDNGIGMNSENFRSFRTYDSSHKQKRGGKGVGRLSWLKVFECAEIESTFYSDRVVSKRSFRLELSNDRPIVEHFLDGGHSEEIGTIVRLVRMKREYRQNMPTKHDTIMRKLAAHFLPYFLSGKRPSIIVQIGDLAVDIADFLSEKQTSLGEALALTQALDPINITHNLLERSVVEGGAAHKVYFTANERVVYEVDIGTPLGLMTFIEQGDARYCYAGVVSGDFLDEAVNSERTAFDINKDAFDFLLRNVLKQVQLTLAPQIERVIDKQAEMTRTVIKKYPRYAYLIDDPKKFVEEKIPRNARSAEQIYQQLAIFDFRENRDIERKVDAESRTVTDLTSEDPISSAVAKILERITAQELSVLADYTARRKVLLDLLDRRLGFVGDSKAYHAEAALHQFIVPMRATNYDVHIDKHNLWILDDKLAYYEHWASDKQMKATVQESQSLDRPDVLLFGGRTAYHRPGTDQPVVVVEFKKPARPNYNDDENPFTQIYNYIDELRGGKVVDRDGAIIQEVSDTTPFFCYIVADLTPQLRAYMRAAQINVPLPGGGGAYGFNRDYNAFIQVLSYKYLVKDARLRNEGFFKHLGI